MYCVCMFSISNEVYTFASFDCSLVKMTSCCLNPNLFLNLCDAVVL